MQRHHTACRQVQLRARNKLVQIHKIPERPVTIILGLVITLGCMLGGFVAMGGHVIVIWQPWEYVIICGAALGTFVVANPMKIIKDTGKALIEGFKNAAPKG